MAFQCHTILYDTINCCVLTFVQVLTFFRSQSVKVQFFTLLLNSVISMLFLHHSKLWLGNVFVLMSAIFLQFDPFALNPYLDLGLHPRIWERWSLPALYFSFALLHIVGDKPFCQRVSCICYCFILVNISQRSSLHSNKSCYYLAAAFPFSQGFQTW